MLSRRIFLVASASAIPVRAAVSPIRIGFLGASYSHFKGKFEVVRESSDWQLVGICESDPEIRAGLEKSWVKFLSREAILSDPEIRVIAVESSLRDHAADGLGVAQSGKHLHLEKPPAYCLKDLYSILNTASSKGRLGQIG